MPEHHPKINGEPSDLLLSILAESEGRVEPFEPPADPAPSMTPAQLAAVLRGAAVARSVGELISRARGQRKLGVRGLARRVGMTHPRVLQLEKVGSHVEVQTLARYAEARDCDLRLAFVPRDGGEPIVAEVASDIAPRAKAPETA